MFGKLLIVSFLWDVHVFMGLQRNHPLRVLLYITHNEGHELFGLAPFRLEVEQAVGAHLATVLFGPENIIGRGDNNLEFRGFFVYISDGRLLLFGGEADPVEAAGAGV